MSDDRLFIDGKPVKCIICADWIDLGNIANDLERITTCANCLED